MSDDRGESRRPMRRLGELLPGAARELGLEEELELATAIGAWESLIARKVPLATGACRLVSLRQGMATVEADEQIVAQELRLRGPELLEALRREIPIPLRQLRVLVRHV